MSCVDPCHNIPTVSGMPCINLAPWRPKKARHKSSTSVPGSGRASWTKPLPADAHEKEFVKKVGEKNFVIVQVDTATGRSPRLPNFMGISGMSAHVISFSAVISACEKSEQWGRQWRCYALTKSI